MPDILTPEEVAECRERAERATDGPWEALGDEIVTYAVPRTASHPVQTVAMSGVCIEEADAEFVAHARTDIPALCATVEALREALKAGQVGHIIEFRDNGWTIKHPLSCRPNLFECEVNRAAERDVDGVPPEGVGRYVCGAEEGGRFWYDGASNAALEGEG